MTDTDLLDFCDEAFKRDFARERYIKDVAVGDLSTVVGRIGGPTTFRELVEVLVKQHVDRVTKRLTK